MAPYKTTQNPPTASVWAVVRPRHASSSGVRMTPRQYHSQSRFDETRSPIMIVFLVLLSLFLAALDDHVGNEIQEAANDNQHKPIRRIMHRGASVRGSANKNRHPANARWRPDH